MHNAHRNKLKGPAQRAEELTLLSIVDPTYRTSFDVPRLLHEARGGNLIGLNSFLATAHRWNETPAAALDQGLHASALCADWRYPWGSSAAPLAGREAKLRRAVAKLPAASLAPFDRATAAGTGFVRQCLPWSPTPATPLDRRKLTVPTLLVNGDHDLSTPLEWARAELKLIPKGRLVVVPEPVAVDPGRRGLDVPVELVGGCHGDPLHVLDYAGSGIAQRRPGVA